MVLAAIIRYENEDRIARRAKGDQVQITYTAKYTAIASGYMGQLLEWPEVITEGKNLDECRQLLQDALQEMIATYRQQRKKIPVGINDPSDSLFNRGPRRSARVELRETTRRSRPKDGR
jgi:predicted RNase H-like HicB family nuclease